MPRRAASSGTASRGSRGSRRSTFDPHARPVKRRAPDGIDRWDGAGALGYLTLAADLRRRARARASTGARLVVASRCFPTGALGYWVRRLAAGGYVALLTATSPRRLPPPAGGGAADRARTRSRSRFPRAPRASPVVADVSMGAVTHGDVIAGRARPEELVPFGGESAHKSFALAVGLELLRRRPRGAGALRGAARRAARARPGARVSCARRGRPPPGRRLIRPRRRGSGRRRGSVRGRRRPARASRTAARARPRGAGARSRPRRGRRGSPRRRGCRGRSG